MTQPAELVQAQPTPFTFLVGEARTGDGKLLNMIEIHSITGMQRYFLSPEVAEKLAEHWLAVARLQRTGLHTTSEMPPLGFNGRRVIDA